LNFDAENCILAALTFADYIAYNIVHRFSIELRFVVLDSRLKEL